MKLREAPFTINVEAFAKGFLELFDEQDRTVLRFGMLPAAKMECLEKLLREKFAGCGDPKGDEFLAVPVDEESPVTTYSLKKVVSEAMHAISCELYRIGDLVV